MNFNQFGALVVADPRKAHAALVALFARHKNRAKVAEALRSDSRTVGKWIKSLMDRHALPDPRDAAAATPRVSGVRARRCQPLDDETKNAMRMRRRRGASIRELADEYVTAEINVRRACQGVVPPEKPARKT